MNVTEDTIKKVIVDNGLETVDEVSDECSAGSGCGSCHEQIEDIIDQISCAEK